MDSPWAFELLPGLNRLGRNPDNDFRLSDPSVSSFHAEISVESGPRDAIVIRDLGSTNGTFIGERRIDEAVIEPEKILRLGNVRLQLDCVAVTPAMSEERAPAKKGDVAGGCMNHADRRAGYRCENCGGSFCVDCVMVMGQDRFGATTVCPICKAQCYPLPSLAESEGEQRNLMARLTQTLRIPFSR